MSKIAEIILAPETDWLDPVIRCGIFPGMTRLHDGSFALLMVSGSEFESADHRMTAYLGSADGETWDWCGELGEFRSNGSIFSASIKPTALPDGRILALGYGFEREIPELSLSDYAEKFGCFPKVRNCVMYSFDGGRSYSEPEFFDTGIGGCEFSGPALLLNDGRLLAFGAPFNLEKSGQQGCCFESCDGGRSWRRKCVFFNGGSKTAWECRSAELKDGRIVVVIWVFDLVNGIHLNNHITVSADGRETFTTLDTGLPGQASNILASEKNPDQFYLLQARREGDEPGIYLTECTLSTDNKLHRSRSEMLFDAAGGKNADGAITGQFRNLKFGQPSLQRTADGKVLLLFWRYSNMSERYEVVIQKFDLSI